jgi:hypothetical protein
MTVERNFKAGQNPQTIGAPVEEKIKSRRRRRKVRN